MPWLFSLEPDPKQLAAAEQRGAQHALNWLLAAMQCRLAPGIVLPHIDTSSPEACGAALADLCNHYITQAGHFSARLTRAQQEAQHAQAQLAELQTSTAKHALDRLRQENNELRQQVRTLTAERDHARQERDQARRLHQLQADQLEQLNQTIVRLNEQLKNKRG